MSRILIVEDDPSQARVLARVFARRRPDLAVVTSSNGAEAIRIMSEGGVDLVLTDLAMPELDGFELLAWIANHCPEVPVFAMSAFGTEDTSHRLDALGAVAYFKKPIDLKAVLERLNDELSQTVRGHVQNVSLASFLQLMEMERKTCTLTVSCAGKSGRLLIRKGALIDASTGDLRGEQAAIAIIAWPNASISISSQLATGERAIETPLGFMIMEAMRVQDETTRDTPGSEFPGNRLSSIAAAGSQLPVNGANGTNGTFSKHGEAVLPSGVRAIAVVDTSTGSLLRGAAADGFPVADLALMAAFVLRQQSSMIACYNPDEGIEELVLSSTSRCDVIRPLGSGAGRFAFLVFAPEETNLVMARLELDRFVFTDGGR